MAGPSHIFVVDDDAAAREMIGEYLQLHGFEVTLFGGGTALRAGLRERQADLIVLDLNMPEEDGLSIVRTLKAAGAAPIVMLTATASPIDRVVGLEMGADDYLAKPAELRELVARIRSILRRAPGQKTRPSERRLAAIVSIDLVGFSRMVQYDEGGTLAAMEAVFADIITPTLPQFNGTLFKTTGDGALLDFASAVDSVEWAVAFQTTMAMSPLNANGRVTFRVGIAIGDVVVNHADRFGEPVTLAVRVQEVGPPTGVAVSDYTHQIIRGRSAAVFVDSGLSRLKNIDLPMRIWTWQPPR